MQRSIKPTYLLPGDKIRIVSPASRVEKDYIDKTVKALEGLGYTISLGKNIFSEHHQFAGTDAQRASDFQDALDDNLVKAIFCARGGYGSVRIIDTLDFTRFMANPKWIVGFSDITVFHCYLFSKLKVPTIHSPMPVNFESPFFEENLKQLNKILIGEKMKFNFDANPLNSLGFGRGKLIGGNLSILYSLQSTPYELMPDGRILFIEDVGEQLYHLDRMMMNLKLSGKLERLEGVVVGGMTSMNDKKRPFGKTAYQIIREAVDNYNYPVCFDFPAGHIDNNMPFLLGQEISLKVVEEGVALNYI